MKDLSLSNALRHMFPSMVIFFYLYIWNPCFVVGRIKSLETLVSIILVVSFIFLGSIFYLWYRPIYNLCVLPLQDLCRRGPDKGGSDNYRTYLRRLYEKHDIKIKTYEAMQLWIQIKERYFKDRYSQAMEEIASGIHLVYFAGISAFLFSLGMLSIHNFPRVLVFLAIAVISLLSAFHLDRYYENVEVRFLYSLDHAQREELDLFVLRIFKNKNPASTVEGGRNMG